MNQLLNSEVFSHFPKSAGISYLGTLTPKLLRFELTIPAEVHPLLLATVISREEKLFWQSFHDLLNHSAALAKTGMQGIFGLDVLSIDIRQGIQNFNAQDYNRLLINHSKDLGPEQKKLVRYGQLFAVLQKRASADFGKLDVITHVEIVDPEKTRKTSYIKKMLRDSGALPNTLCLIHDLSNTPLWDSPQYPGIYTYSENSAL